VHVVALVTDMMDRSRIMAVVPTVEFAQTADACRDADVVVIDLARHAADVAPARAQSPSARIVAFGPHVDADAFAVALRDGADVVLPRSQFFRNISAALT
jgi:hypothetical protein